MTTSKSSITSTKTRRISYFSSVRTALLLPLLLVRLGPQNAARAFHTVRPPTRTTSLMSSSVAVDDDNKDIQNAAAIPTVSSVPASAFSKSSSVGSVATSAADIDWDWKQLAKDVFAKDKRPIILFDGVCNLCHGGVNFAMDQDETGKFRFCSLQSKVGQSLLLTIGRKPNDMTSIILLTGPSRKQAYSSSGAVAKICSDLDALPLQLFGKLGEITPPFLRESIYKFVSTNRHKFGEVDSCRLDFDGTLTERFVVDPPELEEGDTV